MSVRPSRLIAAAIVAALAAPAPAQSIGDRGKEKITKLFREAVATASESTVRIQCDGKDVVLGTVVAADGLVLTKGSELIKGGELRREIACKFADGSSYDATCIGYHVPTDLALLKVDATGLKAVKFSEPSAATVGNWVAAPGRGGDSIAGVGVVSVGVRKLVGGESVIENANKGYLGISFEETEDGTGLVIRKVLPNAAAAKAGLRKDDLIREIDGKVIKNKDKLVELLESCRPGDKVTVRVKRGEEELSLKVRLGTRADFNRGDFQNSMGGSLSGRRTGFPAVIQHDTVVRPADCGGPLVDLDGKVLGINIARAGRVETWALPADVIAKALKDLKSGKAPPPGS